MSRIVVDVSVAAKWAVPREEETLVDEALNLLLQREITFLVPESFWAELGNVFWKAARRGRWSSQDAAQALAEFPRTDIATVSVEPLLDRALEIALSHGRSFYDSLFVALAVRENVQLVTADERLVNALGSRFPVRWLGAYR